MLTAKCNFLLEEAKRRGIHIEMIDSDIPLFLLKKGKKKILFKNDDGGMNSSLGALLAKNKPYTYKILEYYRIPYPTTYILGIDDTIDHKMIKTAIGYPLVVKPSNRGCGKGISIVFKDTHLNKAIQEARKFGSTTVIQKFIEGNDHRIMVVGDKIVAGLMRMPASITGNGTATIHDLIKKKNESHERGKDCSVSVLTKIKVTTTLKAYLKNRYGYTLDTVPKRKELVYLLGNSNLSTGGDAHDITDHIHPGFKRICRTIAKISACPIIGVDIIAPDITESPDTQHRAVIETNNNAQYNIHETTTFGKPRNVAGAILDLYFKEA